MLASSFLIKSSSKLLVTRTGIKLKFNFGPNQTTHFGVTCPWVTKFSHFRTWISLKPVGQSWSNFMCSIIGVVERLHKVLGQIGLAHWTQVRFRCPLGHLFTSSVSMLFTFECVNIVSILANAASVVHSHYVLASVGVTDRASDWGII